MSRMDPDRYRPPAGRVEVHPSLCNRDVVVRQQAEYIKGLERDLRERDAQVRSLNAEVRRLQSMLPRDALKSKPRLTRREKIARTRPAPCL